MIYLKYYFIYIYYLLGEWAKGKRSGEGLYTYANKDVYSGMW